jgi:iron complex transport system substrate-binding protein
VRIVSLLPSATEIVCALGLADDLVGVTVECDFPTVVTTKRVVSTSTLPADLDAASIDREVRERSDSGEGIYRLDEAALRDLDPDLVITQDLCRVCAVDSDDVADALAHLGCSADVVSLDPRDLEDVLRSIEAVGDATGRAERAHALALELRSRLDRVAAAVAGETPVATVVLEWTDPPYNAGHWVPDMVELAGGRSLLGRRGAYSVEIEWREVGSAAPDVVVVAPCGFELDAAMAVASAATGQGEPPRHAGGAAGSRLGGRRGRLLRPAGTARRGRGRDPRRHPAPGSVAVAVPAAGGATGAVAR